ncbi:MAG TPA: bifunctional phosphopantothenoylcysteine decarboxylase/phosphopantothenate--cysteine ligase CoaBC [Polyangiales bacterium]|nr:bifunctional phosphopantothenoylcysteine decarboxylase/phosphopantothenate--cysteine ligase CoaBC [Polyangiales bacterium]
MTLRDKHILVCIGGGIAAFKAVELVRELGRRGAKLRVAMTPSATRFVGPLTFTGLTGQKAVIDLWDAEYSGEIHVELADRAELIVVAPATANLLARAAAGLADDVVLATLACADSPVLMAPAMHERMWRRPSTQRNLATLQRDGVHFVGPVEGALANGRTGMGRMAEPGAIADALEQLAQASSDLRDKTLLISAGPTLEDLDPVRFISNRSSGRMGYALASAAKARGATVILVSGPTHLPAPHGVELLSVRSALEMKHAIDGAVSRVDAVIMTAAVADYRPAQAQTNKMKKQGETLSVELVRNPDILAELGQQRAERKARSPVLVGFAMETHDIVSYGKKKLVDKQVDLIVANEAAVGFGRDDTQVTFITHDQVLEFAPTTKVATANSILDRVLALLSGAPRVTRSRRALRPRARPPARRRKGRSRSKA